MSNPSATPALVAVDLRVDARRSSCAVATDAPVLSWRMAGTVAQPGRVRLLAASTAELLTEDSADLWDSGWLPYDVPRLPWGGDRLASGSTVHWCVLLDAGDGTVRRSVVERFGVALRDAADWGAARWVTHPAWAEGEGDGLPALTTRFTAPASSGDARLVLAAAGVLHVTVNGIPASADVLAPGYAVYENRVPAVAWEIGHLLLPGAENELRIEIGTGIAWVPPTERYSKLVAEVLRPRVLARLEFASGDAIVSGPDWRAALTATSAAHWFAGEDHDARAGDHAETAAHDLGAADLHPVWFAEHPGLRVVEELDPVVIDRLADGTRVYDFGVNVAGRAEVELTAAAGTRLEFWPGELLLRDGRVDQHTTGTPLYDSYVARDGTQTWAPRFVYHGFRYLEVRGLAVDDPDPRLTAQVVQADNSVAGTFRTDDEFLVTLDRIIDRAIRGNMYSVFTDCPNREKLGWIEQLHLCFDALVRHYDVQAHLRDALVHMSDSQLASGSIPSIAPETVDFGGHEWEGDPNAFREDPNWGGAIAFLPWRLYETYGDRRALETAWSAITRYLAFLRSRERDGLLDFGLGDWIALDTSTPRSQVSTFGYLAVLETAAKIAEVLGSTDAVGLRADAQRVRAAFAAAFVSDDGVCGSGSHGSYALALDAGAVPEALVPAVQERLLAAIEATDGRVSAGENSWPSLLRVLHAMGRDDVIDAMVRDDSAPGYAWQIRHGATALAESWFGATGAMNDNSQNHFMLAMVHDWMSQVVGGLAQHPESIGWRHALVAPTPLATVRAARTTYVSAVGEYVVDWVADPTFAVEVTVPPGGAATVVMPDGSARHEVGAGTWRFEQ
jgi:hypothetical protein